MADKTIGELPGVTSLDSDSLFVAQQQGVASKVTGAQLTRFANVETAAQVAAAQAAAEGAAASETAAKTAKNGAETAQTAIENMTVEAETLAAGAQATVQKIVTSGQPIKLLFGLPTGPTGPAGGVNSFNGRTGAVMPATGDYTAEMVGASPSPISSDVTLYVNGSTGNDNNPGTESMPFKSVQAAINSVPKNLGIHSVTINVSDFVYDEKIDISGFSGGSFFQIIGNGDQTIVRSVVISYCSVPSIAVSKIKISGSNPDNAVLVYGCINVVVSLLNIDGAKNGIKCGNYYTSGGTCLFINGGSISNCIESAVYAEGQNNVFVTSASGSNNSVGLTANYGASISTTGVSIESTTAQKVFAGFIKNF